MGNSARRITVPALYDAIGTFLNNAIVELRIDSYVVGMVPKPSGPVIPGVQQEIDYTTCLVVKDPTLGVYYLTITEDEWNEAVGGATGGNSQIKELTLFVGTDVPPGDTITLAAFENERILTVTRNGVAIYNWSKPDASDTLDLTVDGGVVDLDTIQVTMIPA